MRKTKIRKRVGKMQQKRIRTTLRIDNNIKTRIELLAVKNNMSFNKMLNYIIYLGYEKYIEKFDEYYKFENKNIKKELNENEQNQTLYR